MRAEVVERGSVLAGLEEDWQKTWLRDGQADVFASPAWFMNWWQYFGESGQALDTLFHYADGAPATLKVDKRQPYVVVLRDANDVLAIAPLLRIRSRWRRCPVTLLTLAINNHSPRSGFAIAAANPSERRTLVGHIARELKKNSHWDVLLVDGIPQFAADDQDPLRKACARRPAAGRVWSHCYIPFDRDWNDFLRAQGRHFRKRLSQPANALNELGQVNFQLLSSLDDIKAGLEAFMAIDAASWKAESGESIAHHAVGDYYRALALRFANQGACHLWLLKLDDQPAASFLCLIHKEIVYLIKTSYKQEFASARHSPGRVLLAHMIEHYWKNGWLAMDCVGRMPFVERWTQQCVAFQPWFGYSARPLGRLLGGIDRLRDRFGREVHA